MQIQTKFYRRVRALRFAAGALAAATALHGGQAGAHAGRDNPEAPPIQRSVARSVSAVGAVAPDRTVGMIDAGTRFTLLKAFVLPPGTNSLTLGPSPGGSVTLSGLEASQRSQVIPAGTSFVSVGLPYCSYYDEACTFRFESTDVRLSISRPGRDAGAARLLARDLASSAAEYLSIEVPAPIAYGSGR